MLRLKLRRMLGDLVIRGGKKRMILGHGSLIDDGWSGLQRCWRHQWMLLVTTEIAAFQDVELYLHMHISSSSRRDAGSGDVRQNTKCLTPRQVGCRRACHSQESTQTLQQSNIPFVTRISISLAYSHWV